MPQATQRTVNSFVGGLITEASELTFPENASVDELNCELNEDGSRQRRNGIQTEASGTASSFSVADGDMVHTVEWGNVAEQGSLAFLVVQVNDKLYAYDKTTYPVSGNYKGEIYDLADAKANNGIAVEDYPIDAAVVDGDLVVVNPGINIVRISYNPTTDTFSSSVYSEPKIRDFEWLSNTELFFDKISAPGNLRKYDTYNAGWTTLGATPLPVYLSTFSNQWPPLTHPWFTAVDIDNKFDSDQAKEFDRIYHGTSITGNGRFLLNLFKKDRSAALLEAEGVSLSLTVENVTNRFSCVAAYAARAWFSGVGDSKVYFSKVLESDEDLVKFYQINDPTAQDFSDLVDSDGGVIAIPEAKNIKKLMVFNASLLVFAENGVWEISGPDNIFKATEYAVNKVSKVGLFNPRTFVDVEGTPFWWSKFGIHTITRNEVSQAAQESSLSKNTIQTLFDSISVASKINATSVYNERDKVITWLYSNDATDPRKYNRLLHLDISLRAFYPWEFEDEASATQYVIGASFFEGYGSVLQSENVTVNGVAVTHNTAAVTASDYSIISDTDAKVVYLVRNGATSKLWFADTTQYGFYDWGTEDFSSYAVAAYDFAGDLSIYKQAIFITTYFKVTETGWTGDEVSGYDLVRPSSCNLKYYWDLRNTPSNGSGQEVYRLRRLPIVNPADLSNLNYPYDVVTSKVKMRGRGRVNKIKFESVEGKDWHLLGYEVIGARDDGF